MLLLKCILSNILRVSIEKNNRDYSAHKKDYLIVLYQYIDSLFLVQIVEKKMASPKLDHKLLNDNCNQFVNLKFNRGLIICQLQ